jgi:hypothetical protein
MGNKSDRNKALQDPTNSVKAEQFQFGVDLCRDAEADYPASIVYTVQTRQSWGII